MNTIDLKKADGIVKMTVVADAQGKARHFTKSEAALFALTVQNASVAKDNFSGTEKFDRKGKFVGVTYNKFFVRIRAKVGA